MGAICRKHEIYCVSGTAADTLLFSGNGSKSFSRQFLRQRASRAFTPGEFGERSAKIGDGKIRPTLVQKNQLGKRTFPKQKIGETLLAAGADQKVHIG